jgi:hypothetical protein
LRGTGRKVVSRAVRNHNLYHCLCTQPSKPNSSRNRVNDETGVPPGAPIKTVLACRISSLPWHLRPPQSARGAQMKDIHGANRLNGYQPVKWRARLAHATQPVTKRRLSLAVIICRPKNTLPKNSFSASSRMILAIHGLNQNDKFCAQIMMP